MNHSNGFKEENQSKCDSLSQLIEDTIGSNILDNSLNISNENADTTQTDHNPFPLYEGDNQTTKDAIENIETANHQRLNYQNDCKNDDSESLQPNISTFGQNGVPNSISVEKNMPIIN